MPNYRSTVAAMIWSTIIFLQAKGWIDNDTAFFLTGMSTAIFGAININNHIKSK